MVDPRLVRDATITVDLVMKDGATTQFVIPVDTMTFDTNMPRGTQFESKGEAVMT